VPADDPGLTAVIVTHNSRDEIGPCLASVRGQTTPHPIEVVVVDNASTDDTVALVRTGFPRVRVIQTGGNVGFSRANNLGAAHARGAFLLLLNPDTVVPDGAVQTLLETLGAHPEAAVAGPRLVDGDGRPELSFGPPISPWGELWQKVLLSLYNRRVPFVERYIERLTRTPGPRAWLTGACLLIRRTDWDAVGGFDERFFLYTEDVDLCVVLRGRGRVAWFAPDAEVRHLRGRSAARNPLAERLRRTSHVAYYEKHWPAWAGLLRVYLRLTGRGAHD
jgi:N-acetylglucosaminyl-diphospho-decaprenol L-rhamnosyltransferase